MLVCDHRGDGLPDRLSGGVTGGYRTHVVSHLRESVAAIADLTPQMILLDPLAQGGTTELGALEAARGAAPPIPLLVVVDPAASELANVAAGCLKQGAWDLISRNAPPSEYRVRIERLENAASVLARMEDLRHAAYHDDRTDLLRPKAFEARLEEHFSAAQRHSLDLALVLLDLDKFGQVNKDYDHTVGDRLIADVGDVIRAAVRTEDIAARLGGDEFAVILPYTGKVDASAVVNRMREQIRRLSGRVAGAATALQVSTSIGFETFDGSDLDSSRTLRAHAERALRVAKEKGGNQAVYFRGLEARSAENSDPAQPTSAPAPE